MSDEPLTRVCYTHDVGMQNLDPDRGATMDDICKPCQKDDHAWCYRHERGRWWVTCLCPKHDHDAARPAAQEGRDGSR